MPPQPLSHISPDCVVKHSPPDALLQRPSLAAKVMEVIGIWSAIDFELASMTTNFLKSDFVAVLAILNEFKSAEARATAIERAAEKALRADYFKLFTSIRKTTKASRNRRNEFAHHIWACCDELPDALLLIDPKYMSSFHGMWKSASDQLLAKVHGRTATAADVESIPKLDHSKVYVYTDADLDRDVQDARRAFRLHNHFNFALSDVWETFPSMGTREATLPELFALLHTNP